MGQRTPQLHCSSCVTTCCYHEGPGSLEEQVVDILLSAWSDYRSAMLHLLLIPRSHKHNPNVA